MRYTLNKCKICGSEDIIEIDKKTDNLDTYIIYKCNACDGIISAVKEKPHNCSNHNQELSPVEIYSRVVPSLVKINSDIDENKKVAGTGFAISTLGFIITNAHVITNVEDNDLEQTFFNINDNIAITDCNNQTYLCDLIGLDLKQDLAIIKTNDVTNFKTLSFSDFNSIKTGERIFTIGNSKGEGLSITEGLISDKLRPINNLERILISIPVNHGNSGGPILDQKGEVVGMVCSGKKDAVAMNYGIPINQIVEFIKKVEKNEDIRIL